MSKEEFKERLLDNEAFLKLQDAMDLGVVTDQERLQYKKTIDDYQNIILSTAENLRGSKTQEEKNAAVIAIRRAAKEIKLKQTKS